MSALTLIRYLIIATFLLCAGLARADEIISVGTNLSDTDMDADLRFQIDTAVLSTDDIGTLFNVNGLTFFQSGGSGGLSYLMLRGGDPNFTTVLINGVNVNDPTNSRGGGFDLSSIDPASIERIDVYPGGQSLTQGSDAMAGAINIITRQAETPHFTVRAGSEGQVGGIIQAGTRLGNDWYADGNVSFQENGTGFYGDDFQRQQFVGKVKNQGQPVAFQANAFLSSGKSAGFPEDSGGRRLAILRIPDVREYTQSTTGVQASTQIVPKVTLDAKMDWSRRQENIDSPGIAPGVFSPVPPVRSAADFKRLSGRIASTYDFSDHVAIGVGAELVEEQGDLDSVIDLGFSLPADYSLDRLTLALFTEAGIDFGDRLSVLAGVRANHTSDHTDTVSRIALTVRPAQRTTLTATYSEGFKLPSFYALGHPLVGNPALEPETSSTTDITLSRSFASGQGNLRATAYRSEFQNLVDFDPVLFLTVNRSSITSTGFELAGDYKLSRDIWFQASLNHNISESSEPGVLLRRRPEWTAAFLSRYELSPTIGIYGHLQWKDDYFDSSIPTGFVSIGNDQVWGGGIDMKLSETTVLRLSGENIFNSNYEESVGFTHPGTHLLISLSSRM